MTSPRIDATPTPGGTELRLLDGARALAPSGWALSGHPAAEFAQRLLVDGTALEGEDFILVDDVAIARLSATEALRLGLPPLSTLRAVIEGRGPMMAPSFTVDLRWTRPNGQNVVGATRVGAWIQEPEGWRRLPESLFTVAEAVASYQAADADEGARLGALVRLQEALPEGAAGGMLDARGILGTVTLMEADAVSLDAVGTGEALRIVPILHRAGSGGAPPAPLLPEDRQNAFGAQFHKWPGARGVYSLPGGTYVVVAPALRQALNVVRKVAGAPLAQRRTFLRAPRAALREAMGDDEAATTLIEGLVLETPEWSERVVGLGLWHPRVVPWIALPANDWFDKSGPSAGQSSRQAQAPRAGGILVGDQQIALSPEAAQALARDVAGALTAGAPAVPHRSGDAVIQVPATPATLAALDALSRQPGRDGAPPEASSRGDAISGDAISREAPTVLIIRTNEGEREIEAMVERRPGPPPGKPSTLQATLMAHQEEGVGWLQRNWSAGAPGVLLADDMGLGKTIQGLAFLAWLRDGMAHGHIPRRPLLVVAPTGLLANWQAEHDRHLNAPGLGCLVAAYGKGLVKLRRTGDGTGLDRAALAGADWVLTTYETLRDHDSDFGAVRFSALLLDEAQKVKTPGIRLTDAAKAINADFRVALTGTPVENRLADLWCIVDGVAPGHLGDLKSFSATYEAAPDPAAMVRLKGSLDRPLGGRPALLLRRLKEDHLPGLPAHRVEMRAAPMEGAQLAAYEDALALGRDDRQAGRVLQALQRLRAVSLHPDGDLSAADDALVAGSARLSLAVETLDTIAAAGERVLIFVTDLKMMARFATLIQRRYRLREAPMTINGAVTGAVRQARVDRFQSAPSGFDAMLLSPQAGGVGLTLTRASHVIHLARWWNPAVEDQCNGRVLRIGQEHAVTLHLPMAVLADGRPSFDQNLNALLDRKRRLMRDALMPPELTPADNAQLLDETLG